MNILVFSEAAWDDKNSFGNTISNFFCGNIWKQDSFSNFYARKKLPDNKASVSYYNLSAVDILKGFFKFHIEGEQFTSEEIQAECTAKNTVGAKEQAQINKLHQNKNEFVYFGHEQIWRSRLWLNKYFAKFIAENAPNILFSFAASPYILWPLIQYLKKHTQCKIVLLIADDVFGSYDRYAFYRRGYLKREFTKCIQSADKLYGISDEMSALYANRFDRPVTTLYKGCDLSLQPKGFFNQPLRFVYAGNLFWGRDDTLSAVADALERINDGGVKAVLEVYTGAAITAEVKEKLERPGTSHIMGSRPYEEIKQIMHGADVVLHVESFEQQAIDTVRYSFSTKVIDCLQSGNQVLGIGPREIASIAYIRKVPGSVVIDDASKIEAAISNLVKNQALFSKNVEITRDFAQKHHEIGTVQKKLRESFEQLIDKNKSKLKELDI